MEEDNFRYTDEQRHQALQSDSDRRKSRIARLEAVVANPDGYDEGVPEAAKEWLRFLKGEIKPSVDEFEKMSEQFYPLIKNILDTTQ